MESKGTRMALVAVLAAVLQTISAEPQSLTSPNSSSVPMFAGVKGDGTNVGFSWWAVKGAISYELVRTLHPHQKPVTLASLPRTTLGYLDKNAGTGPLYYQLVALGLSGSRVAGAWFQYVAPTVESTSGVGGDVLVVWSGVPKAPGGSEVWRAIDPNQRPLRVGAVFPRYCQLSRQTRRQWPLLLPGYSHRGNNPSGQFMVRVQHRIQCDHECRSFGAVHGHRHGCR